MPEKMEGDPSEAPEKKADLNTVIETLRAHGHNDLAQSLLDSRGLGTGSILEKLREMEYSKTKVELLNLVTRYTHTLTSAAIDAYFMNRP